MPFQRTVNLYNPLAVAGDFASANIRASVLAGAGALVAGPFGVTVGKFAWVSADLKTVTNYAQGAAAPDGFVHRDQQGVIEDYLQESSMIVPAGFPITLFDEGDFFVVANGTAATKNAAVYASYADGSAYIGSAPASGVTGATGSVGSTFTATATGTSLAVTAVTGLISIGDVISGTGVPAGTTIVSQNAGGTVGGAGTYITSVATTATAATVTSFGNVLKVTAISAGALAPGQAVTGTGIPANATIESQVSGTPGGIGVYTLNVPASAYAASTALTVAGGILTNFVCKSACAVGELVKISTWGGAY